MVLELIHCSYCLPICRMSGQYFLSERREVHYPILGRKWYPQNDLSINRFTLLVPVERFKTVEDQSIEVSTPFVLNFKR